MAVCRAHAADIERLAQTTSGLMARDLNAAAAAAFCTSLAKQLDLAPPPPPVPGASTLIAPSSALDGGKAATAPLATADGHADHADGLRVAVRRGDIEAAVDEVRGAGARDLGAPQVPDVRWEDVGGLEDVKRAILDTVELPLRHR
jgi:SpoVK/Ycf46/Vps4 family AAA+-type ATPase